jgi:hypothetical protein
MCMFNYYVVEGSKCYVVCRGTPSKEISWNKKPKLFGIWADIWNLWWNCPTPEIIWDMNWRSETYEKLDIITSRLYCLCRYAHYFYICSLFLWCLYASSSWSNDDWHVLRPTVFVDMLTIFIDAHCVYIWSLFLYMSIVFIYAHYLYICSLFLYMLTIFIYAHWVYICSMNLYMLTVFTYAHCVYTWSLFLYILIIFTYAHYLYIYSLILHMLTVLIYAHYFYICSLSLYMLTVFRYAHCVYMRSLFLHMLTVLILLTEFTYAHCFDICSLFLHMLTVLICSHCFYICVVWSVSSWLLFVSVDPLWFDSFFCSYPWALFIMSITHVST